MSDDQMAVIAAHNQAIVQGLLDKLAAIDAAVCFALVKQEARLDEARQERLLRWHITNSEGQGELDAVVNIEKERLTGMHMLAAALREER